jgi:hypothetical protein
MIMPDASGVPRCLILANILDRRRRGGRSMTAQPVHEPAPDDPAEILRQLPVHWHAQFLTEYRAARDAAREVRRWQQLSDLLHRWRLRATAYADPQFEASAQAARDARPEDLTPVPAGRIGGELPAGPDRAGPAQFSDRVGNKAIYDALTERIIQLARPARSLRSAGLKPRTTRAPGR